MIEKLAILAPGLLGASIAKAARKHKAARTIVLWTRKPATRAALKKQAWCDAAPATPQAAVADADLVILAAPVDTIIGLLPIIAPALKPAAIVTDVGSTKQTICQAATKIFSPKKGGARSPSAPRTQKPPGAAPVFIGSHPMAGSEKPGWQNATATLFQNRTTFITPLDKPPPQKLRQLSRFWQTLGARTAIVTPAEHDRITAAISHLPQTLATTLAATLSAQNPAWKKYAGNGLRDTTRIAASDPAMWLPILLHNRAEITKILRDYHDHLGQFYRALKTQDEAQLLHIFKTARHYRQSLDA